MTTIKFFCPMILPTKTHQQKRVREIKGKPLFYDDDELKAVRQKFAAHFAKYVPAIKLNTALQLVTKWIYLDEVGKYQEGEWKITKPDCSNIIKLPEDVMTSLGFWTDDALVASNIIEKFWTKDPTHAGVYVEVTVL